MSNLILIDGNSLLFRAYFAMRPMITSKGIHTQGIYAFINMLNKIINDYNPEYLAVAFDMKEKTFRHDVYSEYKAGRLSTPIELLTEIPLLHQVLEAMNIKILEMPKYEADDLIGTVAKKASSENISTLVISGDKDELQLVDDNIRVLINKKGMSEFDIYDIEAMKERYSLTPDQFIDLKGLMGDKSDNIPGIVGVGEKKGIALLQEYGNLENIIDHADEIPGKLGENVRDNIDSAKMSKWLATINIDSPIDFSWDEMKYVEPDYNKLVEIYTELEFKKFLNNLGGQDITNFSSSNDKYKDEIQEISECSLEEFLKITDFGEEIVINIDTDDNHLSKPEIKSVCLYSPKHKLFSSKIFTELDLTICLEHICNKNYRLVSYNIKNVLYSVLSYIDCDVNPYYDTEIAEYLINPNHKEYKLSNMVLSYLLNNVEKFNSNLEMLFYIFKIKEKQSKVLENLKLSKLFYDCEMPLTLTLAEMELAGISVDEMVLESIGLEITDKIQLLEEKIYRASGLQFNINSPKQLAEVLFDKLSIPYPKTLGKNGNYSTAADILEKLKFDYEIVSDVLEYRKLSKLNGTYVEGLFALIGSDRKIHPHFQQTVAATGRLSCTEPNLQNIPVRDDYGRLIRKAFVVSKPNNIFVGSDYSQIELRILASLSNDEFMINDFKNNKDIHKSTASRVFNIPEDEVTQLDRSKAKAVNFGVVYGMSGFGLSENLKISRSESQQYISDYFEKHKAVKNYLDSLVEQGKSEQFVRTYFGRIRQIPEFTSRKHMEIEFAKRIAMNSPIQGTAADIIKFAMNSVRKELRNKNLQSKLVLQIHDELIIEGPKDEENQIKEILNTCMKNAADLAVELVCDIHSGTTWYDLK